MGRVETGSVGCVVCSWIGLRERREVMGEYLWVEEQWMNKTEGYSSSKSGVYETYHTTLGELYRGMQREFGRCTGKVYVDVKNPSWDIEMPTYMQWIAMPVGWVFEKRMCYEGSKETFLCETWVTVHKGEAEKSVRYQYVDVERGIR